MQDPKGPQRTHAETEKHAQEALANQLNSKKDYIVHGIKGTFMVWFTGALQLRSWNRHRLYAWRFVGRSEVATDSMVQCKVHWKGLQYKWTGFSC